MLGADTKRALGPGYPSLCIISRRWGYRLSILHKFRAAELDGFVTTEIDK